MEDDSWVKHFKIPTSFSTRTIDCLSTGILTHSCRTEIIQTLAAQVWVHTHYPSRFAYNAICSKLIKVHPKLADDAVGGEVTHVRIIFFFPLYHIYIILLLHCIVVMETETEG